MNGLDGIFALILLIFVFWGFRTGIISAAIWLVAAAISIILGAQLVGWTIPRIGLSENFGSIVTSVGYILVSLAVFTIAGMISASVKSAIDLTPLRWVNDAGGALFGALLGMSLIVAIIAILATFTYVVPIGALESGGTSYSLAFAQPFLDAVPRRWLDGLLTDSIVVDAISSVRVLTVPYAPRELGIAIDVLFASLD